MKKLPTILAVLLFTTTIQAQTVEVRNDRILVDGNAIATITRQGCRAASLDCTHFIRSSEGRTLITVIARDFVDPNQRTAGNPEGKVWYLRFSFADGRGVAEVADPSIRNIRPRDVARIIVSANLIEGDDLNEVEVQNFIQAHGTHFSDRRQELNRDRQIIIVR